MNNGNLSNRIFLHSRVGRKLADDRKTINGILYVLITGCCWHDMPRCYRAYQTAWRRLKRWSKEGVWNSILAAAQKQAYVVGKLSLETVAIDSTLIHSKKVANLSSTTDISAARE